MDVVTVVSAVVVLGLAYPLWIWWKDGKTCQPFCRRVGQRIRSALGVVSQDELSVLQQHVQRKEQQWENRVSKLETAAKFSNQLQYVSKEIEQRLTELEQSDNPNKAVEKNRSVQPPRSVVRLGVRVTLSDNLWPHLGVEGVNEMEDDLIDSMVQGPFCPVCLKRVVRRDANKQLAEVPEQCRYCGISWDCQGKVEYPLPIMDLKRQVYQQLDREYRAGVRLY